MNKYTLVLLLLVCLSVTGCTHTWFPGPDIRSEQPADGINVLRVDFQ